MNAAFQRLQAFVQQNGRLPSRTDPANRAAPSSLRRPGRWGIVAAGVAIALVVLWPQAQPSRPTTPDDEDVAAEPGDVGPTPAPLPIGTPVPHLSLGLDAAEAERIAGPPMFRSAERWEYGPSEIRFVDGKVSGWYSSPLRPLPVENPPNIAATRTE